MARVGLLEDNLRIARLCVTMLNYAGHDVTHYMEASECLHALAILDPSLMRSSTSFPSFANRGDVERGPLPIDVLILDLHLPTLPGLDVLRCLRANQRTRALPLIFCTAATTAEINLALTIAPDATLVEKPFRLQTLVSAISTAVPA